MKPGAPFSDRNYCAGEQFEPLALRRQGRVPSPPIRSRFIGVLASREKSLRAI